MITEIPHDSKYCVSYGQLKGATGQFLRPLPREPPKKATKIISPGFPFLPISTLDLHKKVFLDFMERNGLTTPKAEMGSN